MRNGYDVEFSDAMVRAAIAEVDSCLSCSINDPETVRGNKWYARLFVAYSLYGANATGRMHVDDADIVEAVNRLWPKEVSGV